MSGGKTDLQQKPAPLFDFVKRKGWQRWIGHRAPADHLMRNCPRRSRVRDAGPVLPILDATRRIFADRRPFGTPEQHFATSVGHLKPISWPGDQPSVAVAAVPSSARTFAGI